MSLPNQTYDIRQIVAREVSCGTVTVITTRGDRWIIKPQPTIKEGLEVPDFFKGKVCDVILRGGNAAKNNSFQYVVVNLAKNHLVAKQKPLQFTP